jgi:hypothetical protein
VGDRVLVRTARRIRESLRVVDAGCRFGGDEFVAVLPNTDLVHGWPWPRIRQRVSLIRLPLRGTGRGPQLRDATYPGRRLLFIMKMSDVRLYASKNRQHPCPAQPRRYPRFAVRPDPRRGRPPAAAVAEVQDIGYGGLSFTYTGDRLPGRLEARWPRS